MYKAAARMMIRRSIRALNDGRAEPALAMFAKDATLTFPGDNSWSQMYGRPQRGRAPEPTHRGKDEVEAFVRRYVEHGIQMQVEEILVNGPPWNTRAAVRVQVWAEDPDAGEVYANRAVLMVHTAWGKIRSQEDYEDSEKSAAFDRFLAEKALADRPA